MAKVHAHVRTDEGMIWWVPSDYQIKPQLKTTDFSLNSLSSFVGGYIEVVRSPHLPVLECGCRVVMVVNEEGLLDELPVNDFASIIYGPSERGVVGDVFLVAEGPVRNSNPEDDPEPDFFGLPATLHNWIRLTEQLGRK